MLALLDRDGTLIVHKPYLSNPSQVELLPGVVQGLRALRAAGWKLAVVSNQSGVGRGYFRLAEVEAVHAHLQNLLVNEGIGLDGYFFCPHAPAESCSCRKPSTGLALQACVALGYRTDQCIVIGDSLCDAELGLALGVPTFMLSSSPPAGVHAITSLTEVLPLL